MELGGFLKDFLCDINLSFSTAISGGWLRCWGRVIGLLILCLLLRDNTLCTMRVSSSPQPLPKRPQTSVNGQKPIAIVQADQCYSKKDPA